MRHDVICAVYKYTYFVGSGFYMEQTELFLNQSEAELHCCIKEINFRNKMDKNDNWSVLENTSATKYKGR